MTILAPPIPLGNPGNQFRADYIKSIGPLSDFEYTEVTHTHTRVRLLTCKAGAASINRRVSFSPAGNQTRHMTVGGRVACERLTGWKKEVVKGVSVLKVDAGGFEVGDITGV